MSTKPNSFGKEEHKEKKVNRLAILKEIKDKLETLVIEQIKFDDKIKPALTNLIDAKLFDHAGIDIMDKERQLFNIASKLIELSKLRKKGEVSEMDAVQCELLLLYRDFLE